LEELNRELDQQVKLRTRDLETLTDSVGHDLRNPLNAILTNTQLLMAMDEEAARSENLPILQRMETVVYQMTGIIERLVGLSRASHSTFKRESIDMRTLVSDVIEDLMASEPPPTVTARVGDLPTVDADKVLVGVLITNLLSNAIKFTRQNDNRVIEVSAYGNDPVVFSVKDNGIGFAPQSADRLFVAYDRLDNKTVDGIGLGLAIAARVVQRHGGRIWAEGSPGEGATFSFTLASGDSTQ
jgi:signal transduction histidine kinase